MVGDLRKIPHMNDVLIQPSVVTAGWSQSDPLINLLLANCSGKQQDNQNTLLFLEGLEDKQMTDILRKIPNMDDALIKSP